MNMNRQKGLLAILLLSLANIVGATETEKDKTRYYRHEVNVGVGSIGACSSWSSDYERSVMNHFGLVAVKTGISHGPGTGIVYGWDDDDVPDLRSDNALKCVSYYYHFNNRIAVGGLFGGCRVFDWLGYPVVNKSGEIQKTGYTDVKGTSLYLMPSIKWAWLNNRWCSLYMKATAGFHYQSLYLNSETIPKEQTDEFDKSHLSLGYYVTPFGWEIGKQKVRWFMEFGLGSNTNFQTGVDLSIRKVLNSIKVA